MLKDDAICGLDIGTSLQPQIYLHFLQELKGGGGIYY
jgi:hypothetical protein